MALDTPTLLLSGILISCVLDNVSVAVVIPTPTPTDDNIEDWPEQIFVWVAAEVTKGDGFTVI
jgi:hypothetical protein